MNKTFIPNCVPYVGGNEKAYLGECVDTGWLSPVGPFVDRLEKDFAHLHGVEAAAAVNSGTSALHLGLLALGVCPGDYVLTPTITFVGGINPIKYCGAEPIFLDVQQPTANLDPGSLSRFLGQHTRRRKGGLVFNEDGRRISCLMVTHLYGNPADMDPILDIAGNYGLPVLEDAAESLGARYKDKPVGTLGAIGCFSFNGNKVVTSGGGGIIISRDPEHTRFCKHLSTQAKISSFGFIHDHIGYNYRLSNVCAAVGAAQLEQLDTFVERKRDHALQYKERLEKVTGWSVVPEPPHCFGTYWMALGQFKGSTQSPFLGRMETLASTGIGVRPLWFPAHLMPLYREYRHFCGDTAKNIYDSTICLPSSVGLTTEEIQQVVEALTHDQT